MSAKQHAINVSNPHIEANYRRAQIIIEGYITTTALVRNDMTFPTWIEGTDCFWYERTLKMGRKPPIIKDEETSARIGKQYRLVDVKAATNKTAFDHSVLAASLEQTSGQMVNEENLPISHVTLRLSPLTIHFNAFNKRWQFNGESKICEEISSYDVPVDEVLSPDGKSIAFSRNYNLWVRNIASGEEQALTNDGEEDYSYGTRSTAWGMPLGPEVPALWSPDGSRLLTIRRDKRQVKTLPIVNHVPIDGSIHPQLELTKVAYPGDKHVETYCPLSLEVATGKAQEANYQPITTTFADYTGFFGELIWWAADSERAYFIDQERGDRIVRLVEFDTNSGVTRVVFEEVSDTHINILPDITTSPLHRFLPNSNELVWWSERSGWGHLYLYKLDTGDMTHAITSGDWRVRDVLQVDESRRELWLQTSARVPERDPYYRDICRVNIDSGEITTLASSDEEYVVHYQQSGPVQAAKMQGKASQLTSGVSPDGNYIVTTKSRADRVPVSLLMDREGRGTLELEVADISELQVNWHWPEPVKLLAADSKTDIYGLMFRPSDFSPDKRYPVINYIASAPYLSVVPKGSFHSTGGYVRHYFYGQALAELGFIVLLIDSRGTALRSKAFQDESYGWIPSSANKTDHISGLQQLAERYPFMDMERAGVFINNGIQSGLQHFLECQEVYKVCVAMSILDTRLISSAIEGDKWQGCEGPSISKRYPEQLVDNLQGKLLLMHSMTSTLSASYPPAAMFRVIDALQKANKDFDMLVVPFGGFMCNNYMLRRAWDYLVKHLQGVEPPKQFNLGKITLG